MGAREMYRLQPTVKPEAARDILIRNVRAVRPESPRPGETVDVRIRDGRIAAVGPALPRDIAVQVDGGGRWLAPGWVDIQINDVEWLSGPPGRAVEMHAARARDVAAYQSGRGVTGFILATLASPLEEIDAYLRGLASVLEAPAGLTDAALLGALVEGTFMNPDHCGAHNPEHVLPPDLDTLARLLAPGSVRLLNVAPEVSPAALDVIRAATARGVVVGAGHAKPHAECVREAIDAGLRYVIHLGNGPTGSSLKVFHDGGLLEEALRNDALSATVILDGVHVHPQLARDWLERKGLRRFIVVSDAGFAMGVPEQSFEAFGIRGEVAEEGRYLRVTAGNHPAALRSSDVGQLFGAAQDMQSMFANTLNLLTREMAGVYHRRHAALPLEKAMDAAAVLTAGNPADLLGLRDRGALEAGRRADAVLLDVKGRPGEYEVRVERVWMADSGHHPSS